ncbi:hypothetical protein CAC42_639 [Sphaceloma murrayae]|uniref:Subtelomeric hrmA-associated cluster protein AFUB-079030/YDR124W-like helical bundle domain-containing protein n=1 Tax=Sphaceloma murrayae TaxID=2082308 RepID=A0A2K1QKH2_9PEZI|nr:hypothetical protein CAC42_639 [Sphaceloma murrayae]
MSGSLSGQQITSSNKRKQSTLEDDSLDSALAVVPSAKKRAKRTTPILRRLARPVEVSFEMADGEGRVECILTLLLQISIDRVQKLLSDLVSVLIPGKKTRYPYPNKNKEGLGSIAPGWWPIEAVRWGAVHHLSKSETIRLALYIIRMRWTSQDYVHFNGSATDKVPPQDCWIKWIRQYVNGSATSENFNKTPAAKDKDEVYLAHLRSVLLVEHEYLMTGKGAHIKCPYIRLCVSQTDVLLSTDKDLLSEPWIRQPSRSNRRIPISISCVGKSATPSSQVTQSRSRQASSTPEMTGSNSGSLSDMFSPMGDAVRTPSSVSSRDSGLDMLVAYDRGAEHIRNMTAFPMDPGPSIFHTPSVMAPSFCASPSFCFSGFANNDPPAHASLGTTLPLTSSALSFAPHESANNYQDWTNNYCSAKDQRLDSWIDATTLYNPALYSSATYHPIPYHPPPYHPSTYHPSPYQTSPCTPIEGQSPAPAQQQEQPDPWS